MVGVYPGQREFLEDGLDEWRPTEVPKPVLKAMQNLESEEMLPSVQTEADVLLVGEVRERFQELSRENVSGVRQIAGARREQVSKGTWSVLRCCRPRVVVGVLSEPEIPAKGDRSIAYGSTE